MKKSGSVVANLPTFNVPDGYRPQADDTSLETDLLVFHLLHNQTVAERLQMGAQLTRSARQFSLTCFRQRFSHLDPTQFARKIAEAWLQKHCPPDYIPGGSAVSWIQDSIQLAQALHRIFMAAGIPYYVTGGVAAIAYGEARTTQDLDVVLQVSRDAVPSLAQALEQAGFYVPGVDAVVAGQMQILQITQINTISRADLIVAAVNPYEALKFARRQAYSMTEGNPTEDDLIYLASPEDLVVNKLRWGQRSQSQKQWRDVLGILKTQQGALDYNYMHQWAAEFDLSIQLEQVTLEAGVRPIADQQWAIATYPIIRRAFAIAQQRGRTTQPQPGLEVADGHHYTLIQNTHIPSLQVITKIDDRPVAQFDAQGNAIAAHPAQQDRRNWQAIAQRIDRPFPPDA